MLSLLSLFYYVLFHNSTCQARPEYAVKYNINRCTTCHVSPTGGGPRNTMGKTIGAFGYPPNQWNQNDIFGGNIILIYLRPHDARNARGGMGVMNGSAWINLKINEETAANDFRLVAEQNIGGFNAGPRNWFGRWHLARHNARSWTPEYLMVGRFVPAFGLMTDEHQTYVRLQTGTPWNTSLDMGILWSGNPTEDLHYDIAIVNGRKNSGQGINQGLAEQWGSVLNVRWLSDKWPLMIGASTSRYPATTLSGEAKAHSIYAVVSIARWSQNIFPLSVSVEIDRAKNWNSSFAPAFVSDPTYAQNINSTSSEGRYLLADYEFRPYLSLQYKYDELTLNRNFPADTYRRHGLGFKYRFDNNAWLMLRAEKALSGHPVEKKGTKFGAQDMVWTVLSVSI